MESTGRPMRDNSPLPLARLLQNAERVPGDDDEPIEVGEVTNPRLPRGFQSS